jgi:anti-repressor protein
VNELLKLDGSGNQAVSARELHMKLEVGTRFNDWFPRMCEYGFIQVNDFNLLKKEQVQIEGGREVKREITDYLLTLSMAKEIAMLQRTEKGRAIRQYLIKVEEAWNTPELIAARALKWADRQLELKAAELAQVRADNTRLQIRADEHETYLTVKRVAKLNNIPWHNLDWKRVKRSSQALELEWRKADDLNYGTCNAYNVNAWRDAYPSLNYGEAAV